MTEKCEKCGGTGLKFPVGHEFHDEGARCVPCGEGRRRWRAKNKGGDQVAVEEPLTKGGGSDNADPTGKCDHKFIDSKMCLKCGWTPN